MSDVGHHDVFAACAGPAGDTPATAAVLADAAAAAACELRTALKQVPLSSTASRTSMLR